MVSFSMEEFCNGTFWDASFLNSSLPHLPVCFQHTVLVWIPFLILILCSPVLLYQMKNNRQPALPKTFLLWLRLGIFFLLALSTFLVACTVHLLRVPATAEISAADITAYFLRCVATIYLFVLTVFCALRGIITSGVIFFALLAHVVCGLEEFLECILYLAGYPVETADMGYIVYYVMLLMCFILTSFADKPAKEVQSAKAAPGKKPKRPVCPESTASFLSRCTFSYFDKIAWRGWRYGLQEDDLWSLDEQNRVSSLKKKWEKHWKLKADRCILQRREQLKHGSTTHEEVAFLSKSESSLRNVPSIFWSLIVCFKWKLLFCLFAKTVADILEFIKPQILKLLIAFMETPTSPLWFGYFYAVLLFSISVVYSILLHQYFHIMFCIGMKIKSMLLSAIFEKSLRLSYEARKDTTTGEIVNLMSVDVQKLVDVFPYIILFWSAPMQICIAIGSLWQLLGPSVLSGVLVLLLTFPINFVLSSLQRKCQANQMKFKDTRIKMMNEILSGIRMLKFHAWELAFRDRISKIRQQELNVLRKGAIYGALTTFTWTVSPLLVAVASFATYLLSDSSHELTPQLTFVSLSLFNLLRFPVSMLPMLISLVIQASVSKKRLKKFLTGAEIDEAMVERDDNPSYAVRIEGGSFVWDQQEKLMPNLIAINLTVPRGQCVAVIGQVGSGKSSLCSAILGEMEKVSGILTVNGSISYVPQQAWILNGTVRSNILFTKPMKSQFYQNVLEACALDDEINNMIEKDETEIGEKGINLSGGQKQRLSLARAIYQDTDVYILDDPLSAVDSRVGRHIFDNVIGMRGLLRNKTRILVTNALVYLNEVDLIVIMENGTIKKIGTPAELLQHGKDVEQLLEILAKQKIVDENNAQTGVDESSNEHGKTANNLDNVKFVILFFLFLFFALVLHSEWSFVNCRLCPFSSSSLPAAEDAVDGQAEDDSADDLSKLKAGGNRLISTEVAETGSVDWHVYLLYLRSIGLLYALFILCIYAISCMFSVFYNIWLAQWSEDIYVNRSDPNYVSVNTRIGVYAALGAGQGFSVFIAAVVMLLCMVSSSARLHDSLVSSLLRSPISFYERTPIGRILNRISKDIDALDNTLPSTMRSWVSCVMLVLSTLIIITINMRAFGFIIIPLGLLYFLVQKFYVSTSRQLKRIESVSRSPVYSLFQQILQGITSIRAYKAQNHFRLVLQRSVDWNQATNYPVLVSNRWLATRLELIGNLLVFFTASYAVYSRDLHSSSVGMVGLAVTYALLITQTLNWVVRMNSDLETNIVSVERIKEYIELPSEASLVSACRPPPDWPNAGMVEFKNYSLRYRVELEPALKNISFVARPKEKVGIVGRTGAGKSSITLALFRIVEPYSGQIVIDGIDISTIGLHDLRSRLSIIPQEPVLLCGSLRMNLDPTEKKTDEELWTALEQVHLKSFVSSLPNKLEHVITEGGENLSVGQRQLICLSRALLRKSRILVLDEATAAIDSETDALIQKTIRQCFQDCTVLTIAHRLNTVIDSDRILVLSNGQVIENDEPSKLMLNPSGEFQLLAKEFLNK
ncbi:Multidrug resistance-associated protein 1 [Trichinella pseudospiralis]|uniref:ABC-type glutathione-S-conjugate transporter n=1 Tax=Trichinella pseudospiralis TaxID=6337 RepID=A0A0V1JYL2_TRIPS|nr:Multidrug resistance-associated protein 1 [Trichinella pseudospiralis]KRY65465.1 Multidrug resistance-associated protein 1 [Trichinella pseudospiralis]KRZ15446.1 Multidrug resistance-associated protein 1 [Trichinella pseudospiralis]KRZ40015.1 Multidrug resistance-associated protein 1 [Trichinella pseudospiralis]